MTCTGDYHESSFAAVVLAARASVGVSGPQNLSQFLRIGGTDYSGADVLLSTGVESVVHLWESNPATSGVWDATAINSAEIGILSNT